MSFREETMMMFLDISKRFLKSLEISDYTDYD